MSPHCQTPRPAGLLAWLLGKYRAWSDRADAFDDDFVLTQTSFYWFTNTIATSFRPYYEYAQGITPRVTRYSRMPRGGHFAAHEQPELAAADRFQLQRCGWRYSALVSQ